MKGWECITDYISSNAQLNGSVKAYRFRLLDPVCILFKHVVEFNKVGSWFTALCQSISIPEMNSKRHVRDCSGRVSSKLLRTIWNWHSIGVLSNFHVNKNLDVSETLCMNAPIWKLSRNHMLLKGLFLNYPSCFSIQRHPHLRGPHVALVKIDGL